MESEKSASELYANDLKKFIEKFGNYWYCSIVDIYVDIKNESIKSTFISFPAISLFFKSTFEFSKK